MVRSILTGCPVQNGCNAVRYTRRTYCVLNPLIRNILPRVIELNSLVREIGDDAARGIPEALVRTALDHVLQSQGFRSSRRSQEFLRYVVERTLEGQADALKERSIGIDVFGRSSSYDPSDDATVRVKAGEVRKRLGLYYSDEGAQSPLRIELPSGTYVPEFRPVHAPAAVNPAPPPASAESARPRGVTWSRAAGTDRK